MNDVEKQNAACLVSRDWLEDADRKLNAKDYRQANAPKIPTSRFYDIRPAKLTSAWTNGKATANLIINGAESTDSLDVYDVTGQAEDVGLTTGDYCYIAYRGRWEIVASFVSSGTAASITYVSGFSLSNGVLIAGMTTTRVLIPD